jgi:hypothetical protein
MKTKLYSSFLIVVILILIAFILPFTLYIIKCGNISFIDRYYWLLFSILFLFTILFFILVNSKLKNERINEKGKIDLEKEKMMYEYYFKNQLELEKIEKISGTINDYLKKLSDLDEERKTFYEERRKEAEGHVENKRDDLKSYDNMLDEVLNSQYESIKLVIRKLSEKI